MQADQKFFQAKPTKFNVSREVNGPPVKVVETDRKIPSNINKRKSSVLAIHSANQRLVYRLNKLQPNLLTSKAYAAPFSSKISPKHNHSRSSFERYFLKQPDSKLAIIESNVPVEKTDEPYMTFKN